MHFKLFFSLVVLGCCSASLIGQKLLTVNHDGSMMGIMAQNGMKMEIMVNQMMGINSYDVMITGPHMMTKTLHINDRMGGQILADLFMKHEGVVDEMTFERMLYKIEMYVEQGMMDPKMLFVFQMLNHEEQSFYNRDLDMYLQDMLSKRQFGGMYRTMHPMGMAMLNKEAQMEAVVEAERENELTPRMMMGNQMMFRPYAMNYEMNTPSVWNRMMNYRTMMPYTTQRGMESTMLNKMMNRKMMEQQMENQMEHQMTKEMMMNRMGMNQEMNNQMENMMTRKMMNQMENQYENEDKEMPLGKRIFIKKIEVAPMHQMNKENMDSMDNMDTMTTMGMDNQFWNNYMMRNQMNKMNNMFYGQTPANYYGYPTTQNNMYMRMMRMPMMMRMQNMMY